MRKAWILAAALGAATSFACGAQPKNDAAIAGKVASDIRDDLGARGASVQARSEQGHVTLTGVVQTPDDRKQAERIAQDVAGVSSVTNDLEIAQSAQPPVSSPPPTAAPPTSGPGPSEQQP
jgi:osmotically-inducible protein OsmY